MQYAVTSYEESAQLVEINKYFDIEVQPHYKDEVVVFFKDYHVNPESLKPMIYEIKTQEEWKQNTAPAFTIYHFLEAKDIGG